MAAMTATLSWPELTGLLLVIVMIGGLIGSVGVGGLLLTPTLVGVAGMDIRQAIAVSMASFIATGCVALWLFSRSKASFRGHWRLLVSTMPGALVGALVLWAIPDRFAGSILAVFLIATGGRLILMPKRPAGGTVDVVSRAELPIGAVTGLLSAITGTGGPMVLVPLLAWRGSPLLTAVALGQLVQLPIAGIATIGNTLRGQVDLSLATLVGLLLAPGAVLGRKVAEVMPVALITYSIALVLIASGLWLGWRSI
jgi:uncharacterized membrane protein YfcA